MKKEIVINYYNSLEFIKILNNTEFDFTIYNKSEKYLNLNESINQKLVPNIGREGHTYLRHIIDNYENLADYTIFIQDDFENHQPNHEVFYTRIQDNLDKSFYQFPCTWRKGGGIMSRYINNGFLDLFTIGDNNAIQKFSEKFECNLPQSYNTETCAFFILKKATILKNPKKLYEDISLWLLEDEKNKFILEHTWKIIFN